jgi:hypothetical protein
LRCSAGTNDSGLMLIWRKMRSLCSSFSAANVGKSFSKICGCDD